MAENGNGDSGSKDRATVALVDAKVGIVDAKMDGLGELMRSEFAHIKESIRPLVAVASDAATYRTELNDHERRLDNLESDTKGDKDYRRIHLPAIIISALVGIASIVAVLTQLH